MAFREKGHQKGRIFVGNLRKIWISLDGSNLPKKPYFLGNRHRGKIRTKIPPNEDIIFLRTGKWEAGLEFRLKNPPIKADYPGKTWDPGKTRENGETLGKVRVKKPKKGAEFFVGNTRENEIP